MPKEFFIASSMMLSLSGTMIALTIIPRTIIVPILPLTAILPDFVSGKIAVIEQSRLGFRRQLSLFVGCLIAVRLTRLILFPLRLAARRDRILAPILLRQPVRGQLCADGSSADFRILHGADDFLGDVGGQSYKSLEIEDFDLSGRASEGI